MRPIGWGLIVFIASGMVWGLSSFMAASQELTGAAITAAPIVYGSGLIFFFSIPVAIVAELIRWYRRRRRPS